MIISMEDRKKIAELINTCIVWNKSINSWTSAPVYNLEVFEMMKLHNDAGRELNKMLETEAIILYKHYDSGEAY